ncbi:hypothetical protein OPQ81_011220 [Rhizoctonia solani]|nr:hypothetical protein OPQ81_011220 [Rhizoctonia solani]
MVHSHDTDPPSNIDQQNPHFGNNAKVRGTPSLSQPTGDHPQPSSNHRYPRNTQPKPSSLILEEFPNPLAGMPISDKMRPEPDLATYINSRGLTNTDKDRHLKSSKYQGKTPWVNCEKMLEDINKYLPHGPGQNIIELIQEIIGNPQLNGDIAFSPVKKWTTKAKNNCVIDEMWTANWWWRMQERLGDKGAATIAALILASDKTNLLVICGSQQAYLHATILLSYLPVNDFADIEDDTERQQLQDKLVHRSMEALLEPLKMASIDGIEMWCTDGRLHRVFPIVTAFMADWPEQNLMACELKELNLKPVWPWWATIPYVDFATCIAPDLLHQLYQGIFKTHLMGWLQHMVGSDEVDKCLMAMPKAEGLRHFSKGVSGIGPCQWTGRESKDLVKQVLPIAVGKCSPEFTELVWSVVNFIHQAHSVSMTDRDIDALQHSLNTLHELKEIMVNPVDGYYKDMKRWDKIAKLHMMEHYAHSICELGTPDGYNTEGPKNLHIIYAKEPWRASNKRSLLPQMTKYLQWLDAIRIQCHYMDSYFGVELDPDPDNQDEGEHVDDGTEREGGVELQHTNESQIGYSEGDPYSVAYPEAKVHVAKTPTRRRVKGSELVQVYGAKDLLANAARYLTRRFQAQPGNFGLKPNEEFDVWHRVYLHHEPLPFSPLERPRRDVVRATPPNLNTTREFEVKAGVFDTALMLDSAVSERYRAARVRAIFSLPARLKQQYDGPLAYVELFTPLTHSVSPFHGMHVTSPDMRANGSRRTAVIPISSIAFACHLAPQFHKLDPDLRLSASLDLLGTARHFFLNHYYSHHIYLFVIHWRRKLQEQRERLAEFVNRDQ